MSPSSNVARILDCVYDDRVHTELISEINESNDNNPGREAAESVKTSAELPTKETYDRSTSPSKTG